jgi:hypothetical protein
VIRFEFLVRAGDYSLCHCIQTGSGVHPTFSPVVPMFRSLRVKWPEHEADCSPPSSTEVKNACSRTSIPPYVCMTWCLVKHRDNFTFTFTLTLTLPVFLVLCIDARDWRSHLEQMQKYCTGIDEALATAKSQLDKLHSDISHTLEKIHNREKYLNNQLEPLLIEYRALQVSSSQFCYVADTCYCKALHTN